MCDRRSSMDVVYGEAIIMAVAVQLADTPLASG
jgi:hypothetical protein